MSDPVRTARRPHGLSTDVLPERVSAVFVHDPLDRPSLMRGTADRGGSRVQRIRVPVNGAAEEVASSGRMEPTCLGAYFTAGPDRSRCRFWEQFAPTVVAQFAPTRAMPILRMN